MHIELLWLIPIIAVAAFVLFIVLYFQRRMGRGRDLSGEVDLFNAGRGQQRPGAPKSADDRLHEMETMINSAAEAVARQLRPSGEVHAERAASANEAKELREKLRSVFKEYDIVLSENYTLRAKVKQLSKQIQELEAGALPTTGQKPVVDSILTASRAASKPALHLYDDTRFFNIVNQDGDDLSESDDTVER